MEIERRQPEPNIQSKAAIEEALRNISKYFSSSLVIRSTSHPELEMRGSRQPASFPQHSDSFYNNDRHERDYDDID